MSTYLAWGWEGSGRIPKGSRTCDVSPGLSHGPGGEASPVLQREVLTPGKGIQVGDVAVPVLFREGQGEGGSAPAHEKAQGAGWRGGGGPLGPHLPRKQEEPADVSPAGNRPAGNRITLSQCAKNGYKAALLKVWSEDPEGS